MATASIKDAPCVKAVLKNMQLLAACCWHVRCLFADVGDETHRGGNLVIYHLKKSQCLFACDAITAQIKKVPLKAIQEWLIFNAPFRWSQNEYRRKEIVGNSRKQGLHTNVTKFPLMTDIWLDINQRGARGCLLLIPGVTLYNVQWDGTCCLKRRKAGWIEV